MSRCNDPSQTEYVDVFETRLVSAISQAALQTIPKPQSWISRLKVAWYYEKIKEVNHRIDMFKKKF